MNCKLSVTEVSDPTQRLHLNLEPAFKMSSIQVDEKPVRFFLNEDSSRGLIVMFQKTTVVAMLALCVACQPADENSGRDAKNSGATDEEYVAERCLKLRVCNDCSRCKGKCHAAQAPANSTGFFHCSPRTRLQTE